MRYGSAVRSAVRKQGFVPGGRPAPPDLSAMEGRHEVATALVKEWGFNPSKRQRISDAALEESIARANIIYPLAVVRLELRTDGGPAWLCVDGNRRLRIAQRLGLARVPVVEVPGERVVVELNSTGKTWDTQTWAQYVALVPRALPHVPEHARLQIERAIVVLGKAAYTTYVVDNTLTAIDYGARVAGYLGRSGDIAFIRTAAFWIARHRLTRAVDTALRGGFRKDALAEAIAADTPIAVFAADTHDDPVKLHGGR